MRLTALILDDMVNCYSTWKQSHENPINGKQSWASLKITCRTKCLVWDFSSYFPFAVFFHPPLICSNFCLWSIQKARSLVHSKDSIAVNLSWCLLCKHPLLCWGTSTESIGEVWSTGSILRKHFLNYIWQAASVYEKPHRLPLAKTLPLLYFYTIAFCWAIAFF